MSLKPGLMILNIKPCRHIGALERQLNASR